jgi:phosphatidate cytidylyltransferase
MGANNVIFAVSGIWILLILASLLVYSLVKLHPHKNYQEVVARTRSWWAMLAILTIIFVANKTIAVIFLGFISFIALKEYFSMIPGRRAERTVLFWAYLAIPAQFYFAGIGWFGMFIIFIPIYMYLFIPFRLVLNQKTEGFLTSVSTIQWGLMITVFTLSHMAYMLALPNRPGAANTGAGLLLYLVFLTQFNDVAQYTCGKLWGKRKMIPRVSPNKTWEGFGGGMVITIVLALLLYKLLTPFSFLVALGAGIILSGGGFIGDIIISAIKRDLKIKDTGMLIPGHGGLLDRIDSLTVAAPLFFHYCYYIYF